MALSIARRSLSLASSRAAARSLYTLPELKYGYNELEPIISGQIMEIHHSKHHAT
jgi:Fe-Mn family superoxide dismutase